MSGVAGELCIIGGRTNPQLTEDIAASIGVESTLVEGRYFDDGELFEKIKSSVRLKDVYVVQSNATVEDLEGTGRFSINDSIMEQYLLIRAARRAAANRVTAVSPYFPYSRQDRKRDGRVPISGAEIALLFTDAGRVDQIMSVDLHSAQAQGFVPEPFVHVTAHEIILDEIRRWIDIKGGKDKVRMVSPDVGRFATVRGMAQLLGIGSAVFVKDRPTDGSGVEIIDIIGANVEGQHVIAVDDMITTAGSIEACKDGVRERGALSMSIFTTHLVMAGPAVERLSDPFIERVVGTDTLPTEELKRRLPKLDILSMAPSIGQSILASNEGNSISEQYHERNYI